MCCDEKNEDPQPELLKGRWQWREDDWLMVYKAALCHTVGFNLYIKHPGQVQLISYIGQMNGRIRFQRILINIIALPWDIILSVQAHYW